MPRPTFRFAVPALAAALLSVGVAVSFARPEPPPEPEPVVPAALDATPPADPAAARKEARGLLERGDYADALALFERLLVPRDTPGDLAAADLRDALKAATELGRLERLDALREAALKSHPDNPRVRLAAAESLRDGFGWGYVVDGEFVRGRQRGGGQWVSTADWDRVRALQILAEGLPFATADNLGREGAGRYRLALAAALQEAEPWRFQTLTDLSELPDRTNPDPPRRTAGPSGAPVTEDGTPVFHEVPESWEAAETDGERWRWALADAAEFDPAVAAEATLTRAHWLAGQFGVGSLGYDLRELLAENADAGPWALKTLSDEETIAKLATGPKRLTLPAEHNPLVLYRSVGKGPGPGAGEALAKLAGLYENRRQYPAAVDAWDRAAAFEPDQAKERIEAITGAYARFDGEQAGPAGTPATVALTYRNAERAEFRAYRVDERAWLAEVRDEILAADGTQRGPSWRGTDPLSGWNPATETKWVVGDPVEWSVDLDPPADHTPARVQVETPLTEAGLYYVTATLPNGRVYGVGVRRSDLAVVMKPASRNRSLLFVTDAATGDPVAGASLDLLGYGRDYDRAAKAWKYRVARRSATTDADGLAEVPGPDSGRNYQWLVTATRGDRLGWLQSYGGTFGSTGDKDPLGRAELKAVAVSDRPLYRPGDAVNLKGWIRTVGYGTPADADEPRRRVFVFVQDGRGEEVFSGRVAADERGAFAVSLDLKDDATLGRYRVGISLPDEKGRALGQAFRPLTFRVEEYRKPEFEVTVDAPDEPVVLGETFTATVRAEYLFGGPVGGGVVSYKVTRTAEDPAWHPYDPWGWLYGPGYWCFAPGFEGSDGYGRGLGGVGGDWWRDRNPPEVVAEGEAELSADGTFAVPIDTALAAALHADEDHRYAITAEVTDASRRTEVGGGSVLAAAVPFRAHGWAGRGFGQAGEPIEVSFTARTAGGEPVPVVGEWSAVRLTGGPDGQTVETPVEELPEPSIDADGVVSGAFVFTETGRYRIDYRVTRGDHTATAEVVLNVVGAAEAPAVAVGEPLELIPDRKTYAPGDVAKILVRRAAGKGTVYLFPRPSDASPAAPVVLRPGGGEVVFDLPIVDADAPNIFVEALTVSNGRLHDVVRRIAVPPVERVLEVAVEPAADRYEPREEAEVRVTVTDPTGEPVPADVALTVYDRAIDALTGGSNVGSLRETFWGALRTYRSVTADNLGEYFGNVTFDREHEMPRIGRFGGLVLVDDSKSMLAGGDLDGGGFADGEAMVEPSDAPMLARSGLADEASIEMEAGEAAPGTPDAAPAPTVRENFADTAHWAAVVPLTGGVGTVRFPLPDDLTGWQVRAWAVGPGAAVGSGEARFVTKKSLLVRLQTPRFLTETDEIVLSALVRSELPDPTKAEVKWDLGDDDTLANGNPGDLTRTVTVPAGGEVRADLRVSAIAAGEATVTATAMTEAGPSDAVRQSFPVQPHGTLRTESFAGTVDPGEADAVLSFTVPPSTDSSRNRLEVRFSPSLAAAAVDALPYLAEYPHGCAEQTLNRFLPLVTMRRLLEETGVDLAALAEARTNLNASQTGPVRPPVSIVAGMRYAPNPVFDSAEVDAMAAAGVTRLAAFARPDGGFGWFPGARDSDTYMTALVTRGLWLAERRGVEVPDGLIAGGKRFLKARQAAELAELNRAALPAAERKDLKWKATADSLDALTLRVLTELGVAAGDPAHAAMADFLFRDRLMLPVQSQALLGLAFEELGDDRLGEILSNLRQYEVTDEENQSAHLRLPNDGGWWFWWNDGIEAQAYYLELLAKIGRTDGTAPKLVKYLLNNRAHATYWSSTRDTAHVLEAFAAYLEATGEAAPVAEVEIVLDGTVLHTASVTPDTLFTFDGTAVLSGEALTAGGHVLQVRRTGSVPVYFTARVTAFDTREFIPAAGLEVKVTRTVRRIGDADETAAFADDRGRPDEREIDAVTRQPLPAGATVTSGETVEVELILEAKNDYTYLVLQDYKPAGFEPIEPRSGWVWDGLSAYREFRDGTTDFFLPSLPRGVHSLRYRMRAEAPGSLHALPAVAVGMYAPDLRGNSDEWPVTVEDRGDFARE